MSNMDKDIDFDIIESYKKPITIPAKYLEVFSIVYKGFSSNKNRKVLTRFSIKGSTLIIYKT
jgi:hypothetical protein